MIVFVLQVSSGRKLMMELCNIHIYIKENRIYQLKNEVNRRKREINRVYNY